MAVQGDEQSSCGSKGRRPHGQGRFPEDRAFGLKKEEAQESQTIPMLGTAEAQEVEVG